MGLSCCIYYKTNHLHVYATEIEYIAIGYLCDGFMLRCVCTRSLSYRFKKHNAMTVPIATMEKRVMTGSMAPGTAADILLDKFLSTEKK